MSMRTTCAALLIALVGTTLFHAIPAIAPFRSDPGAGTSKAGASPTDLTSAWKTYKSLTSTELEPFTIGNRIDMSLLTKVRFRVYEMNRLRE